MLRLAGYQVKELAFDGHGVLMYRALEEGTGRPVMIKVHRDEYPSHHELASMERTFELSTRLACPSVVRHLALERYHHRLALVTEDFGTVSLASVIRPQGMPLGEFLEVAVGLAEALLQLHERHVAHNDLRPQNVLVSRASGEVKIVDLGIATEIDPEGAVEQDVAGVEGALRYVSPEQTGRIHRPVDHRSDLYAFGVCCYEMLLGRAPFEADDPMELVHAHIARRPTPPCEVDPTIPEVVSRIVLKLLAKEADARYQSAHGVKHDLATCLAQLRDKGYVGPFPLAAKDVSTHFQIPQKLYGRDLELAALMRLFDEVASGETRFVTVAGYSGVGKTSLVHETRLPIAAHRGYFCAGKFDLFRRDLPYLALAEAFRNLVRAVLTESGEWIELMQNRLRQALGENGRVMTDLVPELLLLVGPQSEVPSLGPVEAQNRFTRVLQAFVGVFATAEHPLVVFLDDLQWADSASIEAIRILASSTEVAHLLVVGGYRDNEVAEGHPLLDLLDDLRRAGRPATSIRVEPLPPPMVTELLADTLRSGREGVEPLSRLVFEKTHGNPFFLRQLLRCLHQDQLLRFDADEERWAFELDAIARVASADNVVELMTRRLGALPRETQAMLEVAACIGAEFDLRTLSIVGEVPPRDVARALAPALEQGLVVSRDEAYKYVEALSVVAERIGRETAAPNVRYRFLHDRVQQAAHERMLDDARIDMHLRIGRLLLADAGDAPDPETIIDLVNHLDVGLARITTRSERLRVAELNLAAGRRAKSSMALETAAQYLALGISLLPEDPFSSCYDLALAVHTEAAETAFARNDAAAMEHHCAIVLREARTILDRVPIRTLQIRAGIARSEYGEAVDVALEVLRKLGVRLPRHPGPHHLVQALAATRAAQGRRTPASLVDLPALEDATIEAAMGVLQSTSSCAYFAEPNLVPLIGITMVRLSLEHGNCSLSAYGYGVYGLVLCSSLHCIEQGYAFGELARAVLAKYPARELAKAEFVVSTFVRHWKEPLADIPPDLLDCFRRCLDVGDVENAVYCSGVSLYGAFFAGTSLESILDRHGPSIRQMQASNQEQSKPGFNAWVELLHRLRDEEFAGGELRGDVFDLAAAVSTLEATNNDTAIALAFVPAGILAFLFGDLRRALAYFRRAARHVHAVVGQTVVPQLHFYRALTLARLAAAPETSRVERGLLLARVGRDLFWLRLWARHAPATFTSKLELIEAVELFALGNVSFGMERAQRSILHALEAGFVHEAAIASEILAELSPRTLGPDLAVHYVGRAYRLYERWGARAKARALERKHEELLLAGATALAVPSGAASDAGLLSEQLDVGSVLKAVRTLTMEMDVERLLSRVMRVVIENAGAERAVLLTMRDGRLVVEAEGGLEGTQVYTEGPAADDPGSGVSAAITSYAARTRQSVVIADAGADPLFARDRYVIERRSRSILCAPLLRRGVVTGVVFLENGLVAGAFTQSRVRVLEILCGQAAISIENARLYQRLERTLADQVALTTAHSRFVPHQFLNALDRRNIVDVELGDHVSKEMSVLFSDIRGFTALMEGLSPAQGIEFINAYLSRMEAPILAHGGFIDSYIGDAIMALFETDADHVVRAALGMLAALVGLNRERGRVGAPPIRMGIGVNTGTLVLGTIGGRNHLKCGVVGDSVNVAARLETLTKQYGVTLLVGEPTFHRLADPSRHVHRKIERVRVVGREDPVTLYEFFEADPPELRDQKQATASLFAEGLERYDAKDFSGAVELFTECVRLAPGDSVSANHLERCRRLARRGVGEGWDGVIRLSDK